MKNKARLNNNHSKINSYSFMPLFTTVVVPLLFGRRKETQSAQEKKSETKPGSKRLAVDKYELTDNIVKFFVAKGVLKKRWVTLKEIPVREITNIETFGNELNVTWNSAVYSFILKKQSESFSSLSEKIRDLLEENSTTLESTENGGQRKRELAGIIETSIGVVDLSFDILMGLNEKRVNWTLLESFLEGSAKSLNFNVTNLVPFNLDLTKVSNAITRQLPKETSKETYNLLKTIYVYFDALKPNDTSKDATLNVQNVKTIILAYFILNDIMFGKVVDVKDDHKEILELEEVLLGLAKESTLKVNFATLRINLDKLDFEEKNSSLVEDTRAIFKEQLNQF